MYATRDTAAHRLLCFLTCILQLLLKLFEEQKQIVVKRADSLALYIGYDFSPVALILICYLCLI